LIPIKKQTAPHSFRKAKRNNSDLTYKEFSEDEQYKDSFLELRKSLLKEQGYVCCYCQSKLTEVQNENGIPLMKTEHFIPKRGREADASLQMEYSNLLGSCRGNSDKKGKKFKNHCDSSKGQKRLKVLSNPAAFRQVNYNQFLRYKERGRLGYVEVIVPNDENEDIKSDIQLLNLNEQNLKTRRYAVWKGIWNVVYKKEKLNAARLIAILEDYDFRKVVEPSKPDFKEFCGFITQWFEKRFKDELAKARK